MSSGRLPHLFNPILRRAMQDSLDGIISIVHFEKVQMDRSYRGRALFSLASSDRDQSPLFGLLFLSKLNECGGWRPILSGARGSNLIYIIAHSDLGNFIR
jgi:hypothetical protein